MLTLSVRLAVLLCAVLAFANTAHAQQDPKFALVASFPSPTVSFQWELSNRFAIRLDGHYSGRDQTTEQSNSLGQPTLGSSLIFEQNARTESNTQTTSIGLSGIWTIRRIERLRIYVAPRLMVGFIHQDTTETRSSSIDNRGLPFGTPPISSTETLTSEDTLASTGAGVSFGISSNVHERVALFGEVGATYIRSEGPSTLPPISLQYESTSKSRTLATRAVAGIMFLF